LVTDDYQGYGSTIVILGVFTSKAKVDDFCTHRGITYIEKGHRYYGHHEYTRLIETQTNADIPLILGGYCE
jgi:hypothetical protein